MAPIADDHTQQSDIPDRRVQGGYRVDDERAASLGMGSGDAELEAAITRMRGAIIRTVNELDRFATSIREARERVEAIAVALADEDSQVSGTAASQNNK